MEVALSSLRLGQDGGASMLLVHVGGFFLVQSGRVCGESAMDALQKALAVVVLYSSLTAFNLAALITHLTKQTVYVAIGFYGVEPCFSGDSDPKVSVPHGKRATDSVFASMTPEKATVSVPS